MTDSLTDVKTRILSRVSLASLIGETVSLETRSGRPVGLCPFHNEKSPSFNLYDDHFYCFGCKKNGDAIDFVRAIQGLGFVDALRYLAGKYGIEAPELEASLNRRGGQRQEASLYKMMETAQEYYAELRRSSRGKLVNEYLLGRGFSEANLDAYGFGVSPQEGNGLVRFLRQKGYREEDMIACSLATASSRDGSAYDFLRGRLTIPIRDQHGRVIGFGGRTMDGSQPKYLNSRESRLFDKSHTLFGFDQARSAMRGRSRAVVVEGYMDTLQLWQAGIPEAVACLGTAFTSAQLKLLRHATGTVVLLFDGDGAGQKATLAAVKVALSVPEIQVKAAVLTSGEDPDSFVRAKGVGALEELLASSSDLLDFAVSERLKTTATLQIPEVVAKEFVPWLAQIPDRLQRSFLVTRIAHLTGIDASSIASQLPSESSQSQQGHRVTPMLGVSPLAKPAETGEPKRAPVAPLDRAGFDLFGHIFHAQPEEVDCKAIVSQVSSELELGPEHAALFKEFLDCLGRGQAPAAQPPQTWESTDYPGIDKLLEQLKTAAGAFVCDNRRDRIRQIFGHIAQKRVKQTVTRLKAEMNRAARDPNRRSEVNEIIKTIQELTKSVGN
jgi:DNA primase